MTGSYTWEWINAEVAVKTVHRRLNLADAEELEAAMSEHRAAGPAGRNWGLVLDLREAGVASEDVQVVLKRVMRADVESGCVAIAIVAVKAIAQMQSARLAKEAHHAPSATFDTVAEAVASVEARLAADAASRVVA